MLEKTYNANLGHQFLLKAQYYCPKMSHGYMYVYRTYNHGEFFCNNLAPKLVVEVVKWFILC